MTALIDVEPMTPEAMRAEFYPSPRSAVRPLIDAKILPLEGPWLEPMAGSGAIIRAIPEVSEWWACELRQGEWASLHHAVGDSDDGPSRVYCPLDLFSDAARDWVQTIEPRVIVTNPANSLAFPAAKLLREGCPDAWLALLQPITFGSGMSKGRLEWLVENTPDCFKLQERPDFSKAGSGGIQEYAWWIWPPAASLEATFRERWNDGSELYPRSSGAYRVLPPSGWVPTTQGVLL